MSERGYYRHKNLELKVNELEVQSEIINCFDKHRRNYGRIRIKKALELKGICVSENKIARILKESGRKAKAGRRRKIKTIKPTSEQYASENLVENKKDITEINKLWCADITEVPYYRGKLYISGIIDVGGKKLVGWDIKKHQRQEIAQDAIKMAYYRYRPSKGIIYHCDRGKQYTALKTKKLLDDFNMISSMSRPGTPSDNQPIESFWKTLKQEMPDVSKLPYEKARLEIIKYIEFYYNGERLHSSLGYKTPNEVWESQKAEIHCSMTE